MLRCFYQLNYIIKPTEKQYCYPKLQALGKEKLFLVLKFDTTGAPFPNFDTIGVKVGTSDPFEPTKFPTIGR